MLTCSNKPDARTSKAAARWLCRLGQAAIFAATLATAPLLAVEPMPIEYLWQTDPQLDVRWVRAVDTYTPSAKPSQVRSPSAAQRMQAAQAIVRDPGNPKLDTAQLHQEILQRLEAGESQPTVRLELVGAFCELDDGSAADQLWKLLGDDLLIRPTLERACIRWRKPMPLDVWRERLRHRQGSQHELARALQGIGMVGTQDDLALLKSAVSDSTQPASLRLIAARAIGQLSTTGQLPLAQELRESTALHADLLAVEVLGEQATSDIHDFIVDIAEQGSPLAQRHAYQWMCQHNPTRAQAKAAAYSEHADAEIRRLSFLEINKTENPEAIAVLTRGLGDVHPGLRELARAQLLLRASRSPEQQQAVEEMLTENLKQSDWKTLEQCVRMTVELEQTDHIPRLLELLEHPRPEVCIAAGWALRHLATEDATLAAMLKHAQRLVERLQNNETAGLVEEFELRRVAHLFEAFGQRQYEPAQQTLLLFVPKNQNMGMITRMAGIWACGRMWEGEENRSLADELCARIADKTAMFPEPEAIRYTATLALGWLADPKTRQALVTHNEDKPMPIGYATEWALERIDAKNDPAE